MTLDRFGLPIPDPTKLEQGGSGPRPESTVGALATARQNLPEPTQRRSGRGQSAGQASGIFDFSRGPVGGGRNRRGRDPTLDVGQAFLDATQRRGYGITGRGRNRRELRPPVAAPALLQRRDNQELPQVIDPLGTALPSTQGTQETPMRRGARPDTIAAGMEGQLPRLQSAAELQQVNPMPPEQVMTYELPEGTATFQGQQAGTPGGVSVIPGRTSEQQRRINERVAGMQKAIYDNMVATGRDPVSVANRRAASRASILAAANRNAARMAGSSFAGRPGSLANQAMGALAQAQTRYDQIPEMMQGAEARAAALQGISELPEFDQQRQLLEMQQAGDVATGAGSQQQPAWRQAVETDLAKRYSQQIAAVPEGQRALAALQQLRTGIDSGEFNTGPYQSAIAELDRYTGGMFGAADAKDAFTALTNLTNLSGTKQLLTGVITDRDMAIIEQAGLMYGRDPAVNKQIADFYINAIQRGIERSDAMRQWMSAGQSPMDFPEEQFRVQLNSNLGLPDAVIQQIAGDSGLPQQASPTIYNEGSAYSDQSLPSALPPAPVDPFGGNTAMEEEFNQLVRARIASPQFRGMTAEQIQDLTAQEMGVAM